MLVMQDGLKSKKVGSPAFTRGPNIEESEVEVLRLLPYAKNCAEFLDARFPERNRKKEGAIEKEERFTDW
jgi:hypothetical protein